MFKKYLQNQNGAIIPLVLIVFMVLMVLGVSAISISNADQRHSIYQDHKTQAYYLAKSGADTMASYLIEKSNHASFDDMNQLIDSISNKTSSATNFGDGNIVIEIVRKNVNMQEKLEVISKGMYREVSDTVTVTLLISIQSEGGEFNSEENALVTLSEDSNRALELTNGAYIDGNVVVNATKENSVWFDNSGGYRIRNGSLWLPNSTDPHYVIKTGKGANFSNLPSEYEDPNLGTGWISSWAFWKDIENGPNGVKFSSMHSYPSINYPELVFPVFPSKSGLPVPGNPNYTTPWVEGTYYPITEDGYYNSIKPSSSRTITIDLAGGDRIVRVGNLDLTGGNIELINVAENSKLLIYVENHFSIGSSRYLNTNGVPDNVHIYYGGNQKVVMDGSAKFSGNIFVKEAEIDFTAGANMKGNITTLGTKVNVSGGSAANDTIIYAPKALVEMAGSAQIRGAVISKSFKKSGGGNAGIIFTPSSYSIPEEFFGSISNSINVEYDENPWR
jgi:hypothetical protein